MTKASNLVALRKIENLSGFVVNYLICGPFNEDNKLTSCKALNKNYLSCPEPDAAPRAGRQEGKNGPTWRTFAVRHGFTANLRYEYSKEGIVSYAAAYLYCPKAQPAKLLLGSDDGFKLYLNGRQVGYNHVHRGLGVDNDILDVNLKKGPNLLLLKIEHNFGAYEFCLRVTDPQGKPIKGLKAYLDHPRVKNPVNPVKQRTVSGYEYLGHKFVTTKQKLSFAAKAPAQYRNWRKKFLAQYKALLGPFPKDCPLRPQITEDVPVENFRRKRLLIDFEPGFSIPCFLTVPKKIKKGQKLPAVLCLHGHGNGKADMMGLSLDTPDEQEWSRPYAMALHAARRGYITISPDFLPFGERIGQTSPFGITDPCSAEFCWAQAVGLVPTTLNIHTVRRCIDYLYQLPNVDNKRIAAMGHSFGGYMTTMTTAVEPRIKVAAISGFVGTVAQDYGKTYSCGSQVIPGLFKYGDLADIVCTMAPRPVLLISGMYDSCSPFPFASAAFKKIKKAYTAAGVPEKTKRFTFPGGHLFQPEAALDWLEKWL